MSNAITLPESTDAAKVKQFVSNAKRAFRAHEEAKGNVTDRAAYATFYAEHVLGLIYQSDRNANSFNNETWAQEFGLTSKSVTTGWRTLGHVLVKVGLGHENETYLRLRNSNAFQGGAVKEACWADGATEETIKAALDARDEEKAAAKRTARPNDGTNDGDESDKDVPVMVRVMAALEVLDSGVKEISPDEWIEVEKRLAAITTRENTIRAKKAATPRRRATTKKAASAAA